MFKRASKTLNGRKTNHFMHKTLIKAITISQLFLTINRNTSKNQTIQIFLNPFSIPFKSMLDQIATKENEVISQNSYVPRFASISTKIYSPKSPSATAKPL